MPWRRKKLTPIPDNELCIRCRDAYRQDGKYCRVCAYAVGETVVKSVEREKQHVEAQRAKLERLKPEPPRLTFTFVKLFVFDVKPPGAEHYGAWVEFEVWNGYRWSTDPPLEWEKPLALRNDAGALSARDSHRGQAAVDRA